MGPDVGSPPEGVSEGTWKNAIPNEIPAMIPRLASMTLVTSVKQPWKRTNGEDVRPSASPPPPGSGRGGGLTVE